mmetsp:Transcript_43685/g.121805  ORF Transcript_43685/g.121805 Transcript_43685/m.121805 type:complete len:242 (+) Transcript_43685:2319-3044(+)
MLRGERLLHLGHLELQLSTARLLLLHVGEEQALRFLLLPEHVLHLLFLRLQSLDLVPAVHLILRGARRDHLAPRRELERGHGLLLVVHGGADAGDQHGPRVPAQRLLQQEGQLRLPEGRRPALLGGRERRDHLPQHAQGLVDGDALFQPIALGPRLLLPLAAGQIHEVDLGLALDSAAGGGSHGRPDLQREDGVGARGHLVHLRGSYSTPLGAIVEEFHGVRIVLDGALHEVRHDRPQSRV